MSEAPRDGNHVTSTLFESSTSAGVTIPWKGDQLTGRGLVDLGGTAGDVVGPASSTDNAIVRFDGTTGKLIQNSVVTIADTTGAIAWDSGQNATLTAAASRSMILQSGGATTLTLDSSQNATFAGTLTATTIFAGAGNSIVFTGKAKFNSPSDGVIQLLNQAGTDFTRLQFGGTTSSFPAIKRNSAAIDVRLADDSAYANFNANTIEAMANLRLSAAGTFNFNGRTGMTSSADGQLTLYNNAQTDFSRLQFGGTTSSFPAIRRTTTALNFRLADDSADAAVTALSYNGLTVSTTTGTLTVTNAKVLAATNSITLSGTDSTVMTFPSTSATIARTDAAQTFTGAQTYSNTVIYTNNAIAASGNAATVPITAKLNTVTNNSAATLTITMTTTSAVDGQLTIVRILDFSGVAQTITWVNTENSTVIAPVTSNGSTTLPLTVGFMYNSATSKWRCIASA